MDVTVTVLNLVHTKKGESVLMLKNLLLLKLWFKLGFLTYLIIDHHSGLEDASNIMRVISLKNYCESTRVVIQLLQYQNKVTMASRVMICTMHNVYFVQYDVPVSFLAQVLDTGTYFFSLYILRILAFYAPNLVYDTGSYFGGNHGSRVWKSLKLKKVYFPRTRASWDKYMFNRIVFF